MWPNWKRADTDKYSEKVGVSLETLVEMDGLGLHPDGMVDRIHDLLLENTEESTPRRPAKKTRVRMFPWSYDQKDQAHFLPMEIPGKKKGQPYCSRTS